MASVDAVVDRALSVVAKKVSDLAALSIEIGGFVFVQKVKGSIPDFEGEVLANIVALDSSTVSFGPTEGNCLGKKIAALVLAHDVRLASLFDAFVPVAFKTVAYSLVDKPETALNSLFKDVIVLAALLFAAALGWRPASGAAVVAHWGGGAGHPED